VIALNWLGVYLVHVQCKRTTIMNDKNIIGCTPTIALQVFKGEI